MAAIVVRIDVSGLREISDVAEIISDIGTIDYACKAVVLGDAPQNSAVLSTAIGGVAYGSVLVEILANPDAPAAAVYVAVFMAAVKGAPGLAALPHQVRERYYSSAAAAEKARQALENLRRKGTVSVTEGAINHDHAVRRRAGRTEQVRRRTRQ